MGLRRKKVMIGGEKKKAGEETGVDVIRLRSR
jgi:hypothetical protein